MKYLDYRPEQSSVLLSFGAHTVGHINHRASHMHPLKYFPINISFCCLFCIIISNAAQKVYFRAALCVIITKTT